MSLLRLNAAFSSLGLRLESALCSSSAMLSERRSRISHVQRIHRKLLSLRDVQNVTRRQCSDVNTNFKQVDSGVPAPNHTKKAPAARLSGKRGVQDENRSNLQRFEFVFSVINLLLGRKSDKRLAHNLNNKVTRIARPNQSWL